MKFSSRIDVLNMIVLIFIGIILVSTCAFLFLIGDWVSWGILVAVTILVYWMFFSINIVLQDENILVKVMFFKKKVKYEDIKEVIITRNAWSSFATSFRRIGIRTSDTRKILKYFYISPCNEEEFLSTLKEKLSENIIFRNVLEKE